MSIEERVKALEVEQSHAKESRDLIQETLSDAMNRDAAERDKLIEKINNIEKKIDKQNTFVGGVIFAVSSVWAVVLVVINVFNVKIGG